MAPHLAKSNQIQPVVAALVTVFLDFFDATPTMPDR